MDDLYRPVTRAEGPEEGKYCLLLVPEDGGKERESFRPSEKDRRGLGLSA